ncbi:MAG: T9SS type A sorting domain-containing protein [bacterium]|nr:T9SS type A sorting domain-containing protein [bacterium]
MHGDNFGNMHTTNDYLRWHRDHFLDLENFILENHPADSRFIPLPKWDPSTAVPAYFDGFEADNTTPFNNISSKCGSGIGSGCRLREDYQNSGSTGFQFNQNGLFNANIPLPSRYSSTGTVCSYSQTVNWFNSTTRAFNFNDIANYTDNQQFFYHNSGHVAFDRVVAVYPNSNGIPVTPDADLSIMGSGFDSYTNRAAAAYIFWLWHAWIDDLWWNWDACHKQNNGSTITAAYDISSGITIATGTTTTWGTNGNIKKIQGNIIIQPGATLIIENGQIVEMLDDYYTDQSCDIIVQAGSGASIGGRLYIRSGAKIRGITSLGSNITQVGGAGSNISTDITNTNIYSDAKVYYLSQWAGIIVYGDPSQNTFSGNHGAVDIDGTITTNGATELKYAKTGIKSVDGGVVLCKNGLFTNCTVGVDFQPYLSSHDWNVNQSHFENTTFTTEDQVTRYVTNDNVWMHYKHDFHHHYHVKLKGVRGISFGGCKFQNMDPNTFTASHDNSRGTGIWSEDAGFYLHDDGDPSEDLTTACPQYTGTNRCTFTNLSFGIDARNIVPATGVKAETEIGIQHAVFTNCHDAINSVNGGGMRIYRSNFDYDKDVALFPPLTAHHHFIELSGTNVIVIYKNTFASKASYSKFIDITNNTATPLNYFTKIQLNKFDNSLGVNPTSSIGVELSGSNLNTDILCNDFASGLTKAIWNLGTLKTQGDPANGAGNKFGVTNCNLDVEQFISSTSAFTYNHNAAFNFNPALCKSSNVTVNLINFSLTVNTGVLANEESTPVCKLGCSGYKVNLTKVNKSENFKLYPNPSNDFLVVESMEFGNNQLYTINIYDLVGKLVLTKNLNENINGFSVETLTPGVYTASIIKNNEVINSIKLVKQ